MKKHFFFLLTFEFCLLTCLAQRDYTKLVNPFIGTGGHGHTYPGASMPFGMMQLSPDTRMADWDGSSGYHYSDSVIYGFSHTHLSGTGIPDYCDILMMPFTGKVQWEPKDYRSGFSHKNEKASPGYYEVLLDKHKIRARLTTSYRSGMHEYRFPAGAKQGSVLIDLSHRDKVLDCKIERVNDYEFKGYRISQSWAKEQTIYFYLKFDHKVSTLELQTSGLHNRNRKVNDSTTETTIPFDRAALHFNLNKSSSIKCKVGISGVSMEGAKANLNKEIPAWDFDKIKTDATKAWNKELSKIDVKGGTKDQQIIFYTALYHTMLAPNIYQDVDGRYRGTDLKIHNAEGFTNYSVFSLWDTYRAYHPLMTLLNQKRTGDWINTFLAQYKNGGMLPVWELSANETFCMIGYHSVPVIWDAYQKGIRNFNHKLALEAMRSYAESNRFGLEHYRNEGYLSNEREHESVSKTLEYAYDDWCIADYAKELGKNDVYKTYIERAQYYKNLFDPETHLFRGKLQGRWLQPFDPREINNFYTEGNAWHYGFAVPQDIHTLIKMHGGPDSFYSKLNELFTTNPKTTGRDQADVTGLIGQYAQGNEPSHHMAYLFPFVKRPDKTTELVYRICNDFYKNAPDGLIGNEDCGQMSAWYVFSALGFYPVTPGTGEYVFGVPLFNEAVIRLENGKQFIIKANKDSARFQHVMEIYLNRKLHSPQFIKHEDIMKGGELKFSLVGMEPDIITVNDEDLPHSEIEGDPIVAVPYFDMEKNKFKDSILVTIKSIDRDAIIRYSVMEKDSPKEFGVTYTYDLKEYKTPFYISTSSTISANAQRDGKFSKTVHQDLHRLPHNHTITISSKVHPLYTAGGPEALIDGVMGTTNWRTGEWQSYFDTDFEAILDLQKEQNINYLAVHALQDVSPWIIFPKEVIFYTSIDGKTFTEASRVKNEIDTKEIEPQTRTFITSGLNLKARYVKVVAINGGKLPAWHESAGNPSHLFIDEIIVR